MSADPQMAETIARIESREEELACILEISAAIESLRVPLLQWRDQTSNLLQQDLGHQISHQFAALWASLPSSRGSELLDLIRDTANFFAFLRSDLQAHPEKYAMTKRPNRDLRGPYPTTLREVREELDYWASRQNEGLPGSSWEEAVKNRIEHLTRLERRLKEEMEHIEPRPGSRHNVAAWVFGTLLLLFFMAMVVWNPKDLAPTQVSIVRLLGSILVGIISAFFSGNLQLGGKVPGLDDIRIAAIGGFGAFVLVYLLWK